jgi:hypothetical protein
MDGLEPSCRDIERGGLMPERGDAEAARAGGHDPRVPGGHTGSRPTLRPRPRSSPHSSIGSSLAHHGDSPPEPVECEHQLLEPRAAPVATLAHHLFERMPVPHAPYCIVCKDCLIFLIILANVRRWLMRWFRLFSIPIMRKNNIILPYCYYFTLALDTPMRRS